MPINVRVGQSEAIKVLSSKGGGSIETFNAKNVIGGIASVTQLDVTGISTLGTIEISSGIITSTNGNVVYFGDVVGNVQGQLSGIVEGDVTGNLTGSVLSNEQENITLLGTLSSLVVSGNINANGNIVGDNDTNISGINNITAGANLNISGVATVTGELTAGLIDGGSF